MTACLEEGHGLADTSSSGSTDTAPAHLLCKNAARFACMLRREGAHFAIRGHSDQPDPNSMRSPNRRPCIKVAQEQPANRIRWWRATSGMKGRGWQQRQPCRWAKTRPRRPPSWCATSLYLIDVEDDVDLLDSPAGLTRWLREHELLRRGTADNAALDLALRLHGGRSALSDHHDGVERSHAKLERIMSELDATAVFRPAIRCWFPRATGVRAALGQVVVAMARTEADGTWRRLKLCREYREWAFLDTSKNRSRTWYPLGIYVRQPLDPRLPVPAAAGRRGCVIRGGCECPRGARGRCGCHRRAAAAHAWPVTCADILPSDARSSAGCCCSTVAGLNRTTAQPATSRPRCARGDGGRCRRYWASG